ncbi:MAG: Ig-like domain-containing protein [Candidatus Eisenbacteria bacterium]
MAPEALLLRRSGLGRLAAVGCLLLGAACARIAPPQGGPEDREAPRVIEQVPDSGAVAVALDTPIEISFSERMNRSAVQDGLRIAPWPGRIDCRWDANRLLCTPAEGWREGTTYTVLIGAPSVDRRRNALTPPLQFAFSTGDSLERCEIAGTLHTRSLAKEGVAIYLFAWPAGLSGPVPPEAELRPEPLEALRIAEADGEGTFRLSFVPSGVPLMGAALYDSDGNRSFDEGEDLWGFSEFPIVCADSAAVVTAELYLVYGEEEGDLAGEVRDSLCAGFSDPARLRAQADSLNAILSGERDPSGFLRAAEDTLAPVSLRQAERESLGVALERVERRIEAALADSVRCMSSIWVSAISAADSTVAAEVRTPGAFRIESLAPGLYFLQAFRDLSGDALPQPEEPHALPSEPIELKAGREVSGVLLQIQE